MAESTAAKFAELFHFESSNADRDIKIWLNDLFKLGYSFAENRKKSDPVDKKLRSHSGQIAVLSLVAGALVIYGWWTKPKKMYTAQDPGLRGLRGFVTSVTPHVITFAPACETSFCEGFRRFSNPVYPYTAKAVKESKKTERELDLGLGEGFVPAAATGLDTRVRTFLQDHDTLFQTDCKLICDGPKGSDAAENNAKQHETGSS